MKLPEQQQRAFREESFQIHADAHAAAVVYQRAIAEASRAIAQANADLLRSIDERRSKQADLVARIKAAAAAHKERVLSSEELLQAETARMLANPENSPEWRARLNANFIMRLDLAQKHLG